MLGREKTQEDPSEVIAINPHLIPKYRVSVSGLSIPAEWELFGSDFLK